MLSKGKGPHQHVASTANSTSKNQKIENITANCYEKEL